MNWTGRLVLVISFAAFAPAYSGQQFNQANEKNEQKSAKTETLEGVIDQTGGVFVIAGADRIRPIAKLRAEGFTENNFARFLGLKVRIKGTMVTEQDEKFFIVRSLDDIKAIGPTKTK